MLASLAEALGRSPSEMLAYIEATSETRPKAPPPVAQLDEPAVFELPKDQENFASMRIKSSRTESQRPETGSLRALLAVLEHLSENDLRILLAPTRRLAGSGG